MSLLIFRAGRSIRFTGRYEQTGRVESAAPREAFLPRGSAARGRESDGDYSSGGSTEESAPFRCRGDRSTRGSSEATLRRRKG